MNLDLAKFGDLFGSSPARGSWFMMGSWVMANHRKKTWVLLGFRCADELVVFFTSPMKWVPF